MIKMIATRTFPYQGKVLKKGDAFEARDKTHARQLRDIGFANDAVRRGRPPKPVDAIADTVSDVAEVVHDVVADGASKRKTKSGDFYQTRSLIAD